MGKKTEEGLFLAALAVGVAYVAYLAFANRAQANAAPIAPPVNADMGGEDFGANNPGAW
jgi:hypothetical protein